ncbi:hypothetical protein E2C01_018418 [Portunus trituberculatus]|uniref:Uncharacterized protein n=1 Tax=Portunus trituberculatus TaxID=210409 RepID=A0A5B7DUF5_PORTR|nr:hypothetical protein [Portunus trituberculatus]
MKVLRQTSHSYVERHSQQLHLYHFKLHFKTLRVEYKTCFPLPFHGSILDHSLACVHPILGLPEEDILHFPSFHPRLNSNHCLDLDLDLDQDQDRDQDQDQNSS